MKKLLITFLLIPQLTFAECDWKSIKKVDKGYLYNKACHVKVGVTVKKSKLQGKRIVELEKTIKLKDLAITTHEQRVTMWRATTYKLEDRMVKIQRFKKYNDWVYFILGVFTTSAAVYSAGQLRR